MGGMVDKETNVENWPRMLEMQTLEEILGFLAKHKKRDFTSTEIEEMNLFPWAKNSRNRTALMKADMFGDNILKARIQGEMYQTRYMVTGANIIRYLTKHGPSMMMTVRPKKKRCQKQ